MPVDSSHSVVPSARISRPGLWPALQNRNTPVAGSIEARNEVAYFSGGVRSKSRCDVDRKMSSTGTPSWIGPAVNASNDAVRSDAAMPFPDTSDSMSTTSPP